MKIDYTIKGTKLPTIPAGTEYRVIGWSNTPSNTKFSINRNDFISFGCYDYKGCLYILCERSDYTSLSYFMIKLSDIEKLTKTQEPMRTIKYSDAQRIVDIACSEWKELLFNSWGKDIVLKKDINIPSENYQNMRKVCTQAQHKVFDEIFGEDKPQFKVGDWVIGWHINTPDYKNKAWEIGNIDKRRYIFPKKNSMHNCEATDIRLATEEEIKAANVFPDGTPCLVRDVHNGRWMFAYANGKGGFYNCIEKSGMAYNFEYSMKLDMNNLPVNE